MKIKKLYPEAFGKFQKREFQFSDGLNVIYGENEAGKSTLTAFLRAMLFGLEKPRGRAGKQDPYTRYQPLDTPGAYQGAMELEIGEKEYRIERVFYQNERRIRLTNRKTGREIPARWEVMQQLLPELSESGFLNTVSVPQSGAATDATLAAELQNYMANLSAAKKQEVDVSGAISKLSEQIRQLDAKKLPEQIRQLEQKLEQEETQMLLLDQRAQERREAQERLLEVEKELSDLQKEKSESHDAEFSVMFERFLTYRSNLREYEDRQRELLAKKESLMEAQDVDTQEEVRRLEVYREKKQQILKKEEEMRREEERFLEESKQRAKSAKKADRWLCILSVLLLLTAGALFFLPVAAAVSAVCALALFAAFAVRKKCRKRKEAQLAEEQRQSALQAEKECEAVRMELADEPTEEEQSEQIAKLREEKAIARSHLESLAAQQKREKKTEEDLRLQEEALLAYFRQFGEVSELTEPEVRNIQGRLLAQSASSEHRRKELLSESTNLQNEIARLDGVLEQGVQLEAKSMEYRTSLCELQSRLSEDTQEKQAILLAQETLKKLSEEIHDSFGKELNKTASAYVKKLTNGAYRKLTLDEKLQLKVDASGRYIKPEQCSAGTLEQLYLAVRLAVGETMYQSEPLPLIFDDAFAYYDDARLLETLRMLAQCGRQVLLFTCHKREARLLKEAGLAFNAVSLGNL